jgi:hypothetical protein
MPRINTPEAKHETGFHTPDGNYWEPYTDKKKLEQVKAAFEEVNKQVFLTKGFLKTCNAAFAKLPGKRNFDAVWKDPGIWVSYNPNEAEGLFGITYKKDVAISAYVFTLRDPVRWIAATLVHELAHVNGAPGTLDSKDAEATLPPCGFDDKYNPATVGAIRRPMQVYIV